MSGKTTGHSSEASTTPRDTQAEYWADLDVYWQRSLAAKRQKVSAELTGLPAERYQGPVSPEEARRPAEVSSAAAAASAEPDDLADVSTDEEDFDHSSQEGDDEDTAAAAGPSTAGRAEEGAEQAAMVALPDRYAPPGREGWATRNKHKYACQAGGQQVHEQNEKIALQLDKLSDNYKAQKDTWREYAYSKAAKVVRGLTFTISCASQVREVRGIGPKVAAKIQEIIDTGGRRQPVETAVVPQLTSLAFWGGLSRLLAALRTRDEPSSRSGPQWQATARPRRAGPRHQPTSPCRADKATDSAAFGPHCGVGHPG